MAGHLLDHLRRRRVCITFVNAGRGRAVSVVPKARSSSKMAVQVPQLRNCKHSLCQCAMGSDVIIS
jgi:hypothetical protein